VSVRYHTDICDYVLLVLLLMQRCIVDTMELARYVGDRLHDLLGISDKYVAEYLIGLAGKSSSAAGFIDQLRDTDTVTVDDAMIAFAQELWSKVYH